MARGGGVAVFFSVAVSASAAATRRRSDRAMKGQFPRPAAVSSVAFGDEGGEVLDVWPCALSVFIQNYSGHEASVGSLL